MLNIRGGWRYLCLSVDLRSKTPALGHPLLSPTLAVTFHNLSNRRRLLLLLGCFFSKCVWMNECCGGQPKAQDPLRLEWSYDPLMWVLGSELGSPLSAESLNYDISCLFLYFLSSFFVLFLETTSHISCRGYLRMCCLAKDALDPMTPDPTSQVLRLQVFDTIPGLRLLVLCFSWWGGVALFPDSLWNNALLHWLPVLCAGRLTFPGQIPCGNDV